MYANVLTFVYIFQKFYLFVSYTSIFTLIGYFITCFSHFIWLTVPYSRVFHRAMTKFRYFLYKSQQIFNGFSGFWRFEIKYSSKSKIEQQTFWILIWRANSMDSSRIEKNVVFLNLCTVGKIYTPISSFLRKRVVNIVILELGPVSNERPGNFTF